MFRHSDWPHARPAAAVRYAKGLVQVQMANIRANISRTAKANLRIQVRAIHINLPSIGVNDFANLLDALLEHAVSGGIGYHERGQFISMRLGFGAQIRHVNVALLVTGDRDDFQSCHDSAGGIGPVCGSWNEANTSMWFASLG